MAFNGFSFDYFDLGMQPCNGGTAAINANAMRAIDLNLNDSPTIVNLCSLGSGTSIATLLDPNDAAISVDAVLTNASQWSQSGYGYEVATVKSGTDANARRMICADTRYIPTAAGFCVMALICVPATLVPLAHIFGKSDSGCALTKGYGVRIDAGGTNVEAWVDNPATAGKTATVSVVALPVGEYVIVTLKYTSANGGTLKLRIDSSNPGEAETTGVGAATWDQAAGNYSSFYAGATPATAAGYGLLVSNCSIIWTAAWRGAAPSDAAIGALAQTDPFLLVTFPRDTILTIEDPATVNGYTKNRILCYIPTAYDKASHSTIFEVPATPGSVTAGVAWTQQMWLDSTFGDTATGTISDICSYADYSNRTYKQVCDALPAACIIPSIFANGDSGTLKDSSTQNVTDARQKMLSAIAYFTGITNNPFATDTPSKFVIAGMSSGFNGAFELAMGCGLATRCICRHGEETNSSGAQITTDLNQYLNTYYNNNYTYSDPISLTWGAALSTFTGGTTAGSSSSSGYSNAWASNATAKAMEVLMINGASDGTYAADVELMLPVMRAAGYVRLYHKIYSGGIHDHHGRDRDLTELYISGGIAAFFGSPRIITDDGEGLV